MGLKKKVSGQWIDDSGIDFRVDNSSILNSGTANIATTGSYDGDSTSANYNPVATKDYVDQAIDDLPEPMVWTGVISITADSTDTTKCTIAVSAPASAADIKKGFTYKVSFITASPTYTGTLKIGDTFVAAKDAPKTDKTWVEDTDWNVVPSGDETGFLIGVASGTSENELVSFGVNGYTAKNSGVSIKASTTAMSASSDTEVPTSKNITANVAKTATISSGYAPAQAQAAITVGDTIEQALGKLEKEADDNKNNILSLYNQNGKTFNLFDINRPIDVAYHATAVVADNAITIGSVSGDWAYVGIKALNLPTGSYRVSGKISNLVTGAAGTTRIVVSQYSSASQGSLTYVNITQNGDFSGNFFWTGGDIYLLFYVNNSPSTSVNYTYTASDIQIISVNAYNAGFTDYQPYALSNATITPALKECVDNGAKNRLPATSTTTSTSNGLTLVVNSDYSITITGTMTTVENTDMYFLGAWTNTSPFANYTGKNMRMYCKSSASIVGQFKMYDRTANKGYAVAFNDNEGLNISGNLTAAYFTIAATANAINVTLYPMICDPALWAVSQQYVPPAMSNAELTAKEQTNENNILSGFTMVAHASANGLTSLTYDTNINDFNIGGANSDKSSGSYLVICTNWSTTPAPYVGLLTFSGATGNKFEKTDIVTGFTPTITITKNVANATIDISGAAKISIYATK